MLVPARIASLLLLGSLPTLSLAASGTAAISESTITVSGGGLSSPETYRLAQMYGDWYATATDAHASLTMRTLPGAHQAQLGIEWDGKEQTQTIDAKKNDDIRSGSKFSFHLHLMGAGAFGQDAQPRGSDVVTVTIARMDSLTLEATFSGTVTSATNSGAVASLKIAGAIKLHRETTAEKPADTFGSCDPHIYDKLAGAEWRSPSECEVKFDGDVRKGLTAALQPAIDGLTASGWKVVSSVETQPLTSIPRHTESKPFQLVEQTMHQGGAFYVTLGLPQNSPIYQHYNQAAMDLMQKAIADAQAGKSASMDAALDGSRALEENTKIGIGVAINQASTGIENFKGGHTVKPLPDGGFTVEVPYTQAPTGGDITAAERVTFLFLGAWAAPGPSLPGAGEENIQVKGSLNAAKLLAVENVRIRIQGGTAQAQQVIKLLDWNALRQLVAEK